MNLDSPSTAETHRSSSFEVAELERVLEHAAHALPAQGPISIFVHHNTLHAYEGRSFAEAVVQAADVFGCEPWLSERRFHGELERGRIEDGDLVAVVAAELGAAKDQLVSGFATRLELRLALLRHRVDRPELAELDWLLAETDALERFRPDAPRDARRRVVEGTRRSLERSTPSEAEERAALRALWHSCLAAASNVLPRALTEREHVRHRDWLLELTRADSDALAHPMLIRFVAAYLDQGLAFWPMPERELGLLRCFRRTYVEPYGPPGRFMRELRRLVLADAELDAFSSIGRSLQALGVERRELTPFVRTTLLALRGWAGMVHQVEERPDRVPVGAPPVTLADFLAVRLLVERAALGVLAREHAAFDGPLSELRRELRRRRAEPGFEPHRVRAFVLFQLAQLLGRSAVEMDELDEPRAEALIREIESVGELERRRLLHLAYERRYSVELLDALVAHSTAPQPQRTPPRFQAVFCIDEREESIRRHLEEVAPDCETFGVAGFFGVAMYYRGAADARPRPLCPVIVRPEVEVDEQVVEELRDSAQRRARLRNAFGRMALGMSTGSRTFTSGALLTALGGTLAAFPLVFRVLFPRSTAWIRERTLALLGPPDRTRLALEARAEVAPLLGQRAGFTPEEMADMVRRLLEETGLGRTPSPLIVLVGHGSSSLNNPHESAHDCGACGGGRGGPNARAFAQMANDPRVRALLERQGLSIPAESWFVGAYHDTCDDSVAWFDLDLVPEARAPDLELARQALETARARNAHERCRRFAGVPAWFPTALALAHVEARSEDLAQTRPEYGHATNAACVVGRRSRTRGLFLDRRVFLASYDSSLDEDGALLARVLGAVVPVTAGINLEYYFSHVDPRGYGCDTKLPHNVSALLGVMDGHASDLRTGLPWQMVEIHEPVRLLLVVEATPDQLTGAISHSEAVRRLVQGAWIQVALLDPVSAEIQLVDADSCDFLPYEPESPELPVSRSSSDWYSGRAEHLRCARIDARAAFEPRVHASSVWHSP
jgi:uncharacterized protein YbcC (UPF0753/DUF2309 family)